MILTNGLMKYLLGHQELTFDLFVGGLRTPVVNSGIYKEDLGWLLISIWDLSPLVATDVDRADVWCLRLSIITGRQPDN